MLCMEQYIENGRSDGYDGGMKYFAGTRFDFDAAAGLAEVVKLKVGKAGALAGLSVSGSVFRLTVSRDGEEQSIPLEHGKSAGELTLHLPAMVAGEYRYELTFTDSMGDPGVLLHGVLTVFSRAMADVLTAETDKAEQRTLCVEAGSLHAGPLELRWSASSLAAKYAQEAKQAALGLEDVREAVREFRVFVTDWLNNMETFLIMNPVTGTIWVNGYDTGQPYRGEDGKAPRVNAYGFWEVFIDGQWVTLPYHAEGEDGLDGTQVRRVLLDSLEELPTGEERGVYYYTPKTSGSGYDMWLWLDNAGWVCFGGDPYGVATETSLGLVKLGTRQPVTSGAPVGLNELKQMMVAMATTSVAGAMKPSSEPSETGGGTHFNASGNLLTDVATYANFGSVRPSVNGVLTEGGLIGMDSNGRLYAKRATTGNFGTIKLGTSYPTNPGDGYRVGIGEFSGEICTAFVPKGALRHWKPNTWSGKMDWVDGVSWPSPDSYYTCLLTSEQFTQTEEKGLVLKAATRSLRAGVRIAGSMLDDEADQVLNVQLAREAFALKEDAVTKAEAVLKTDPWLKGVVMTEDEYNALGDHVDPEMTYILV